MTSILKPIPRKWAGRKTTRAEEEAIEKLQKEKRLKTYLEAKHEYFENLNKGVAVNAKDLMDEEKNPGLKLSAKNIIDNPAIAKRPIPPEGEKKRKCLTIGEAKLGVTMVLDKDDCKKLGIPDTTLTRDAIKKVRDKLGLAA